MAPTFDRFDLSTFSGRFKHYLLLTNPLLLLISDEDIIRNSERIILDNGSRTSTELSAREFWQHEYVVKAAVHPSTNEIIPKAFRVCAIAPVNIPIIFGMISCPPTNVVGTLGLHFINQSYNTACNYSNRSGGDLDTKKLTVAYTLAVTSACGLAYGFGKFVQRGPPLVKRLGVLIPCVATAAASCR